jgi:outer membrane biosynthesis protein TonB
LPEIDLSTLDDEELRGLLASVRQRGQAAQSYQILEELAERRAQGGRRGASASRRRRIIEVDLGDPLDREEDLYLDPPESPAVEADPPLVLEPAAGGRRPKPTPSPRRRWPVLTFSVGAAVGVIAGFGIAHETFDVAPAKSLAVFPGGPALPVAAEPAAPAPPAPAQPAPLAVVPAPPPVQAAPEPAATPEAPPQAAAPQPVETAAAEPAPKPKVTPAVAIATTAEKAPAPEAAEPEEPAGKPTETAACGKASTPADRAICGDDRLRRLQADLRSAYADALEKTVDRATLRQRQLAWRDARSAVSDPDQLASLYEARTRKLKRAAAAALAARRE